MVTLYVQEQGATVCKRDQQILVTKEGARLHAAPVEHVDHVVIMGRGVQISTPLLVDLLERGVPVTLTNRYGNRHYATLTDGPSRFAALRLAQGDVARSPERALDLARGFIRAKLANQRAVLAATGWPIAPSVIERIGRAAEAAERAPTLDILRGHEGDAAAAYFGAWRASLPPAWGFTVRAYHPPPDPINAALSFGYTLALHGVLAAIQMTGLDPYLGLFHVPDPGRPALALDLLEEFRPALVDRLVLDLVRTGTLTAAHFVRAERQANAVHLDATGRAILIDRYEAHTRQRAAIPQRGERTTLRRLFLAQAQAVARVVRGEQERYAGFSLAQSE